MQAAATRLASDSIKAIGWLMEAVAVQLASSRIKPVGY